MTATRESKAVTLLCVTLTALSCTGINWPYRMTEDTPVRSIDRPDSYIRGSFGKLVVPVFRPESGTLEEGRYVALSAGGDSPTSIYTLSMGESIGGSLAYVYASAVRSDPYALYFTGAALASVPVWEYMGTDRGCVIVGEPGFTGSAGGFTRYCLDSEDDENPRRVEGTGLVTSAPATALQAGRSLAVLPVPGSDPASLAYLALGAEGSVHLLNAGINKPLAPSLEPPAGDGAEDFGVAVAAGLTGSAWPGWVAVGSVGRVYVFGVWDDASTTDADPDHVWLQACYESATRPGFGTLLWSGDADGDGATDLAVGSDPDTVGRVEDVVVVSGATFHSGAPPDPYPAVTCSDVPESIVFACQPFPDRGVQCDGITDFGSSFAVGDLDDDGSNEVVIGMPGARIGGKSGAGAVLVFDPAAPAVPVSALRDSYPEKNAHLGTSVAVNEIAGMDEVIAGSPGSNEVFVFYCSGVGTDDPDFHSGNVCR
jgi:hypothetical protein